MKLPRSSTLPQKRRAPPWPCLFEQHGAVQLACRGRHARRHRMLLGLVLGIGGCAHGFECGLVLAFGIEQPSAGDLPLDVDLLAPIGILRLTQLVTQLGELGDVRLGRFLVTRARLSQRASKNRDRLDMGERAGPN